MKTSLLLEKAKQLSKLAMVLLAGSMVFASCNKDDDDDDDNNNNNTERSIKEVSGIISGNVTWSADTIYRLNGFVRVGEDNGTDCVRTGVLTIEPGTLVIGDRESKGTLVVQRCSQIIARGTKEKPIVMTSERPVGSREPGDWGGLVICGRASNNTGGIAELEGGYGGYHGGNIENDNSGVLEYVRIEYAGVPLQPNQEVNSLTMGSVGNGTTIRYVMCSFGLDDSFEWFGGSVNCSHLIAYRGLDDDLDVDLGFSGHVQFALCIRANTLADQSGSNGFEVDNDGQGTTNTPFTSASFSNVSIIGPKATRETPLNANFQHAAHLRRNNKLKIYNSIMTGYPYGIYIDGSTTEANATNNELVLRNVYIAGVEHWGGNGYGSAGTVFAGAPANGANHPNSEPRGTAFRVREGSTFDLDGWFREPAKNNRVLNSWKELGIDPTIFEAGAPKVTPNANSILLSGANFAGTTGFQAVPFVGAFGTDNWTDGWAEWNPIVKEYIK